MTTSREDDIVFELIGRMRRATITWAEGVIDVVDSGDRYSESFWCRGGATWRVQRSDGLIFTDSVEYGSWARMSASDPGERGPYTNGLSMTYAGKMLQPAKAMIWGGMPDEWRLTSEWSHEGEDLYRIRLTYPDAPQTDGSILVDRRTGYLREMVIGDERAVMRSLELVNTREMSDAALLELD